MNQDLVSIFLGIVGGLGSYYVIAFFKEKGTNDAKRLVLEEFTNTAESIKNNLEFLKESKLNLSVSKQNAIIDFNKKYAIFLNSLLTPKFFDFSIDGETHFSSVMGIIHSALNELLGSEANLDMFFSYDEELILLKKEVIENTMKIYVAFHAGLLEAKSQLKMIENFKKKWDVAIEQKDVENAQILLAKYKEGLNKLLDFQIEKINERTKLFNDDLDAKRVALMKLFYDRHNEYLSVR